ncbi:DUF4368 domain-containing protein [bacterium 1xD42-67]|nr:DUF4368 domain-containing protein [bacterium 1xD42-67]
MNQRVLIEVVLTDIRAKAELAKRDLGSLIKRIRTQRRAATAGEIKRAQTTLTAIEKRLAELSKLTQVIYEDNVSGKLTDERFMKMSQRYDEEQQQLKKDIEELQRQCDRENDRAFCKEQFLKAVRKFMEMKTLTPTILHELVERIDVYQT